MDPKSEPPRRPPATHQDDVIGIRVSTTDLGRTVFAYSPLAEVTSSVRMLASGQIPKLHQPWYDEIRPRLDEVDLPLLSAVMPYRHHLPDFLLAGPADTTTRIESQLERLAAVAPDRLRTALERTWAGAPLPPVALRLLAKGPDGSVRLAEAIADYWEVALAPYWQHIRSTLDDDIAHRSALLAAEGLAGVIGSLHPDLRLEGDTLLIAKPTASIRKSLCGGGLMLVPSVFVWPHLAVACELPHQLSITYGVRRLPRPWFDLSTPEAEPAVAALLGRTRATILAGLELPQSTTDLAELLGQSPSSVSQHLTLLRRSGLVRARRSGRWVQYQRTAIGDALFASAAPRSGPAHGRSVTSRSATNRSGG